MGRDKYMGMDVHQATTVVAVRSGCTTCFRDLWPRLSSKKLCRMRQSTAGHVASMYRSIAKITR